MIDHKYFIIFFAILFQFGATEAAEQKNLHTYFTYTGEELHKLENLDSEFTFTDQDLKKWDAYIKEAFKEAPGSIVRLRLTTYLYVAQREAAQLAWATHGKITGSLDPISYLIVKEFLPLSEKPSDFQEDQYSSAVAAIIFDRIYDRIQKENHQPHKFEVPKELESDYFIGLAVAKWIPWVTTSSRNYWPPAPPRRGSPEWKKQIQLIRNEQNPLTDEKKNAIYLWAGLTENPDDCDWICIANKYLFSHRVSLPQLLQIRYILSIGMYDSYIVSFSAKYNYLVLRPSMVDPTLQHEIPVPNHPSYPSNHSLTSATAVTILIHFFPADKEKWDHLLDEAGLSRIWAGIHYPLDDVKGRESGRKIAINLLRASQK